MFFSVQVNAQDEPGSEPRTTNTEEEQPPEEPVKEPSPYRNPQGSVPINATVAIAVGSDQTVIGLGLGVGYAVITGVVPGIRGLLLVGGEAVDGELATTLTLTPPLSSYIVPFVFGEVGRRFDTFGGAWLLGAGGGVYLGEPETRFGLQIGWVFRKLVYEDQSIGANGPLIAIAYSF